MSRLIWIYAVCKSLFLSPVAVKELNTVLTKIKETCQTGWMWKLLIRECAVRICPDNPFFFLLALLFSSILLHIKTLSSYKHFVGLCLSDDVAKTC